MNDRNEKNPDDRVDEDSLRGMLGDFYNRRMLSTVILVWANGLVFIAMGITSAVLFFRADQTKYQIMYATIFLVSMLWLALIKVLAWLVITRNSIKRDIRRLENRLTSLN